MKKKKASGGKGGELEKLRRRVEKLESIRAKLKHTEKALAESEQRYKTLVEGTGEVIFTMDENGVYRFINSTGAQRLGREPEDFVGKTVWDVFPKEIADRQFEVVRRVIRSGRGSVAERLTQIRGEPRWYWASVQPLEDQTGRARLAMTVAVDITERKRTEAALRESEERFRKLFEHSNDAIFIHTLDGRILDVNGRACEMLGYDRNKLLSVPVRSLHPDDEYASTDGAFQATRESGSARFESRFTKAGGETIDVEISSRIIDEEQGLVEGIVRDISQRKQGEQALRESRQRLQYIIDNTWDIIFQIDLEGNYTFANKAAERITGYPLAKLLRTNMRDLLAPEYRERTFERLRKRIAGEPLEQPYELELIAGDGQRKAMELTTTAVYRDGELVGVQGIARDVTPRKQAEAALRESRERFRNLIDNLPVGVYRNTPGARGKFLMVNRALARLHGYESVEEFLKIDVAELHDSPKERKAFSDKLIAKGEVAGEELLIKRRDGTHIWGAITARVVPDADGRPAYFDGIVEDITERKQAQEALRESERRMRLILENTSDGISFCERDPKTGGRRLLLCNDRYVEMSGRSREELMAAEDVGAFVRGHTPPEQEEENRERLQEGLPRRGLASWIRPDGEENYHEWTAARVGVGEKQYVIGIDRDITERKRAEEALRESERRMRLILENTTDGIDVCERDPKTGKRRLVLCNDRFVEMSGRSREDLMAAEDIGELIQSHTSPEQERQNHDLLMRGLPHQGQASWIRPDGKENYYEWTSAPIQVGEKQYLIGIDRDMTQRMRTEAALGEARRKLTTARDAERRRLAAELHDSVGQGLIAMQLGLRNILTLYLDRHRGGEHAETVSRVCEQCDGLIREVRSVCRGLYPPTLELGLATALGELARDFQGQARVAARCDIPPAAGRLSHDIEIALFRIAQEAVVNAVRHGHAENITLELTYENGQAVLTVRDDGTGFEPAAVAGKGLGLSMMNERVRAVGGELTIDSGAGGSSIRVRVPTTLVSPAGEGD